MAAQDDGGSRRTKKLTAEQRAKIRRRTTPSSRQRLRDRYLDGDERPRPDRAPASGGSQAPRDRPYAQMTPWQQAVADSNVRYGPTIREIDRDRGNVQPYFDQYRAQVAGANDVYTQQSAPVVQQAQTAQQNVGAVAPGAANDPDAQLAAQSRSALMGLGVTALQGIVNANQGYFAGRAGPVAGAQQLQTQSDLDRERRDTVSERQQYRVARRGELRSERHRERLENQAFGLDAYEAETDRRDKRRDDRADRRREGGEVNKYGYTDREWRGMTTAERQKVIERFDGKNGGGNKNDFTPLQRRETKATVRKGIDMVLGKLKGKSTAPANFWQQARSALINERDFDPALANAVIQIIRDGKVKPGTMKTIRRDYGVEKLPRRKPFVLPDPYVLPDRPATQPGDRPVSSP